MLLVANVPAKLLADKLRSPLELLLLLGMSVVCLLVSEAGWRFLLRPYTTARSLSRLKICLGDPPRLGKISLALVTNPPPPTPTQLPRHATIGDQPRPRLQI